MSNLVGVLALLTLVGALVAHGLLVRALARRLGRGRIALDALLPPLAILDGLTSGARREALIAIAAVVLHGVVVVVGRTAVG